MDPGVPSVPITTLAGVASLTDLLPEMPLPTPSPQTLSNKSLLFHPRVAEEAQNLLGVRDEFLIPQLVTSLEKTSAEHIEVKDNYAGSETRLEQTSMPELLRAMLDANPHVFKANKPPVHASQQLLPQQQQQLQMVQNPQAQFQNQPAQQQLPHVVPQPQQLDQQNLQQQWNHTGQPTIPVPGKSNQLVHQQAPCNSQTQQQPQQVVQPQEQMQPVQQAQVQLTQQPPVTTQQPAIPAKPQQQQQPQQTVIQAPQSCQKPSQKENVPQKPPAANCNNTTTTESPASSVTHSTTTTTASATVTTTTTSELRQLRRNPTRGQAAVVEATANATSSEVSKTEPKVTQPAEKPVANHKAKSKEESKPADSDDPPSQTESVSLETKESTEPDSDIKQPVIKLKRLTEEEQSMIQKSLKDFIESKPDRAKDLGISLPKEEEASDTEEEGSGRKRRRKRNYAEEGSDDEDYQPDTFSALVSGNKKRKVMKEEHVPEPVVEKPKLRKVEKKFVPVLEKLSLEEL
ncbi:unnamed protein product, partial [Callosobruchus maculatus]